VALPVLALQEELLSGFPVNKKEVLVYKDNLLIFSVIFLVFLLIQFQAKYPADPVGSHKAKIKSHPGLLSLGLP
jgi:hypothetical protein